MERRYQARLDELLDDAEVRPGLLRGLLPRLETFLEPFVRSLCCCRATHQRPPLRQRPALRPRRARTPRASPTCTTANARASRSSSARPTGTTSPSSPNWPARSDSAWARPTACWSSTPPPSPSRARSPSASQRQWCGRLGKVENCQVGVYLGYVSHQGHALVDFRLYLPREWTRDRKRMNEAGVPREVRFATRHELALADARRAGRPAAAPLGRRRRRDGAQLLVPPAVAPARRALPAGRAEQHPGARPGAAPTRRTPGTGGARRRRSCAPTSGARRWRRTTGRRSRCATGRRGRC